MQNTEALKQFLTEVPQDKGSWNSEHNIVILMVYNLLKNLHKFQLNKVFWILLKMLEATLKFNDPYDLNLFGPVIERSNISEGIITEDPLEAMNKGK